MLREMFGKLGWVGLEIYLCATYAFFERLNMMSIAICTVFFLIEFLFSCS